MANEASGAAKPSAKPKAEKAKAIDFVFEGKTFGFTWGVDKNVGPMSLKDHLFEHRTDKDGKTYLVFKLDGVKYAYGKDNLLKAFKPSVKQGDKLSIPVDARFTLTPKGAVFA